MYPRQLLLSVCAAATLLAAGWGVGAAASKADDTLPGGDTTVIATGRNAFSLPSANLDDEEIKRAVIGNSFFKRNWVEAPASATARDGLGPHFIARSCGGCHGEDGRGQPPHIFNRLGEHEPAVELLIRLSVPGSPALHEGVVPEPTYGDQFNNAAVQGVQPEGQVRIRYTPVAGRFADGRRYTLQQPSYTLTDLNYGPLQRDVMLSPRIAPQLIGVGLLEAITEVDIETNARQQAASAGPVKGQVNRVWDAFAQREMLGRFGWKANVATLAHQTAAAFKGDIGITSSVFNTEACTAAQTDCQRAPHGAATAQEPEIDDKTLDDVVFYQATLAPPARRNASDTQVQRGQWLFQQAQCTACHRPSYVTGQAPFPRLSSKALEGQTIWPYTDLLLHDMGPGLADGRPDHLANGHQWKTPPLWGIGLIKDVNKHQRLLHDGRARGTLEAILWHGGEAQASQEKVRKLSKQDQAALVKFVDSL
jgi:CxxC motif-containing protein (DUF1111 family)